MTSTDVSPYWLGLLKQCDDQIDPRGAGYLMKLQLRFYRATQSKSVAELRAFARALADRDNVPGDRDGVTFDIVSTWVDKGKPFPGAVLPGQVPPIFPPNAELISDAAALLDQQYATGPDSEMMGFVSFLLRTIAHERDGELIQYRATQLARSILDEDRALTHHAKCDRDLCHVDCSVRLRREGRI